MCAYFTDGQDSGVPLTDTFGVKGSCSLVEWIRFLRRLRTNESMDRSAPPVCKWSIWLDSRAMQYTQGMLLRRRDVDAWEPNARRVMDLIVCWWCIQFEFAWPGDGHSR
jgi:hypothetical protein